MPVDHAPVPFVVLAQVCPVTGRWCRYRGQPKAHLQHVFTAIAVNIERLSRLSSPGETTSPRPPTTFQDFLDQNGLPRLKSRRAVSS